MKLLVIIGLLFQVYTVSAACDKNVQYVKENEQITAKCDGFYVKFDTMNELKNNDEILKLKEKEIVNLKDISFKQEQIAGYYQDRASFLNAELKKEESRSFWKGTGMFVLGVLVTGAASYVAIQATR